MRQSDFYSDRGSCQNIGRIVDAQIDSNSADYEDVAIDRDPQPAREEEDGRSQTEKEYGVITGEGTPSDKTDWVFTDWKAELKERVMKGTLAIRKSDG